MTDAQWQLGPPPPRMVIEFPGCLSEEAITHIRETLDWLPSGKPLVLQEGARVRMVHADGTVTPTDAAPVTVSLSLPAFLIGLCSGSLLTLIALIAAFALGGPR